MNPSWKSLPDCIGSWVYYPDSGCKVVWWICEEALADPGYLLPLGGRWFGPIPPDKVEEPT